MKYVFLISLIVDIIVTNSECRVLCQDSFATTWLMTANSCPLRCQNIVSAVETLNMIDHESLLNSHKAEIAREIKKLSSNSSLIHLDGYGTSQEIKSIFKKKKHFHNEIDNFEFLLRRNGPVFRRLRREIKYKMARKFFFLNWTCSDTKYSDKDYTKSALMKKLARGGARRFPYDMDFITEVTKILNEHARTDFKFNDEMTELLIKTLFGDLNFRNGVFDITTILGYLQRAIRNGNLWGARTVHFPVMKLRSKHCMPIRVPGCYCTKGYVENDGQCVRPEDCIGDNRQKKYLKRVVIIT